MSKEKSEARHFISKNSKGVMEQDPEFLYKQNNHSMWPYLNERIVSLA